MGILINKGHSRCLVRYSHSIVWEGRSLVCLGSGVICAGGRELTITCYISCRLFRTGWVLQGQFGKIMKFNLYETGSP